MSKISNRPDPNAAFPNPKIPSLCYIKNVVKNPRIVVGDYTYYDDVDGADQFEKHVTHFYDFIGDRLIIGKFCAIANVSVLHHGWRLGQRHRTGEGRTSFEG